MPPLPLGLVRTGVALLLLAVSVPCSAQLKNPQGVPVLLLSGGQREHHGYRDQANALAKALEQTGQFRVTIAEDAARTRQQNPQGRLSSSHQDPRESRLPGDFGLRPQRRTVLQAAGRTG